LARQLVLIRREWSVLDPVPTGDFRREVVSWL